MPIQAHYGTHFRPWVKSALGNWTVLALTKGSRLEAKNILLTETTLFLRLKLISVVTWKLLLSFIIRVITNTKDKISGFSLTI